MKATSGGSGRRLSSKLARAQSPATHSSAIRPGTPARLSRTSASRLRANVAWWAPGASIGLPRVTMPETRSGRRTARPRAIMPPRLWPTIRTRRPRRATTDAIRDSSGVGGLDGAADVGTDVGAVGAVALLAQGAGHQGQARVTGQEPRHQHHRVEVADRPLTGVRPVVGDPGAEPRPGQPAGLGDHAGLAQHRRRTWRGVPLREEEVGDAVPTQHDGHEDRRYDVLPRLSRHSPPIVATFRSQASDTVGM